MDNKENQNQEEGFLPEDLPEVPAEMEPLEPGPVIEETSPEEIPMQADPPAREDAPMLEDIPMTEESAAPEEIPAVEATPVPADPAFPEQIPDAQEPASTAPLLTDPQLGIEITPDEKAMDSHGMLEHGEEEPFFDMSILDDPEFALPVEPEPPQEEVNDQEYRDNGKDFDAIYNAPADKKGIPAHDRPARKGRPKRKKGEGLLGIPNILVTFVWLALIVVIGVTAGRMLWVCAADVLAFGREDKPVTVTIYEADTMEDITEKLYDAGLIRYRSLFNLYSSISDAEEDIKPGIYDLNTRYDYHALVSAMSPRSSREVVKLTIPEGYTCRQIFALLEENRICTAVDIAAYAADGELGDYWFLEDVERGTQYCLEGFLFPDTYEFYKNSTPREALQKMLDNFEYRFDEELREDIDGLNNYLTSLMQRNNHSAEYISEHLYGIREIVIVASLIEREAASSSESPNVAGVIYNRLFDWGDNPALLGIDAAIVYAQGGDAETIDTSLDSPYNTYLYAGLTPTPISNPGLSSLKAALNPEDHDYYYYVLNPSTGMHQFSKTRAEHEAWIEEFYR